MTATSGLRPGAVSNRYLLQQFLRQSEPVASLSGDAWRRAVIGRRLVYRDDEPAAQADAGTGFMYSMVLIGVDVELAAEANGAVRVDESGRDDRRADDRNARRDRDLDGVETTAV